LPSGRPLVRRQRHLLVPHHVAVPDDRVKEAVRALHERYIEQQRPLVP
jgi:hypothetical protein